MAKKMLIDATHAEETRVVVVDGNKVEEFDFESENKRQLAGNIYLAKVIRVEPSLQAAFVDYGGGRHGFLAFSEIHPDYYQIPVADREALLEEERAYAEATREEDDSAPPGGRRGAANGQAAQAAPGDAPETGAIAGMDVIEPGDDPATEPPGDTPGDEEEAPKQLDASEKDDAIESVADEDVNEEIRRPRKPRLKRYNIQEVIKVRQILLVQVVKEERGNKGAALTTYLSLAGRYCVLMPNTARGGGISRKITNAADRKKLKTTAAEIEVPGGAGLIIRTAGANRTKAEIKRDYEYLQRLWEQIRELTLKSIAPAKIYAEGDLIKRSIRDLYSREIDEVLVEGEAGYRTAKDFMKMIMPSHAKNVKHYAEPMPLFARYQVESYLAGMFNPTVQLKSGGYIVIGVTEALVAIDVNSGRSTRQGSVEETALRTNLEAAEEVARQLRLRDLAGLIVIDFIDMDERRNNTAVEKRLKDRLRTDRARIQAGRISGFGLLELSRQRLRPGMIEATTQPCTHCHGTGLIRSDDSLALTILRQLEEEGVRRRSREILVKAPVGIVNFLINAKRGHLAQIEARYDLSVRIEADQSLISPDFTVERFKVATRPAENAPMPVVSVDVLPVDEPEAADTADSAESTDPVEDAQPKKKRRRRSRRRRGARPVEAGQAADADAVQDAEGAAGDAAEETGGEKAAVPEGGAAEAPGDSDPAQADDRTDAPGKKPRRRVRQTRTHEAEQMPAEAFGEAGAEAVTEEPTPKPKPRRQPRHKKAEEPAATGEDPAGGDHSAPTQPVSPDTAQPTLPDTAQPALPDIVSASVPEEPTPEAPPEVRPPLIPTAPAQDPDPVPEAATAAETEVKPRRRGWWSIGR